jgi:hypothetical protein
MFAKGLQLQQMKIKTGKVFGKKCCGKVQGEKKEKPNVPSY